MDKKVEIFIVVVMLALGLLAVYAITQHAKQSTNFRKECEAAGGIPFQPKHAWVCLKKDQVQPINGANE